MAVTAKFVADFSSFYDAVRKADAQLIDLSSRAGGAEKALSRMVDNFSGRRLVQDATLMAEAVGRIGGVSKLTEAELRKVSATANEAAAKLRAMGQDVPPGIQNIVDQTQNLNTRQSALIGTLKSVAGAFGIAFSAQQLVAFVNKTIQAGGAIQDMADTLGVSTDAVQQFTFAAKQTGAEMGAVESAINDMNRGLATGDKSTVKALKALGLEFSTIRNLRPEDAFTTIAAAIQQIEDPMEQSRVAMELFGKSGKELLPAIKNGFVDIGNEAPRMSAATIAALDRAGDALDKFKTTVTIVSGEVIAVMMDLPRVLQDVTSSFDKFAGFLKAFAVLGPGSALLFEHLKDTVKGTDIVLKPMNQTLVQTQQEIDEAARAAEKAAEAQRRWNQSLREFKNFIGIRQMEDYTAAQAAVAKQIEQNVRLEFAMNKLYLENAAALGGYAENVGVFTQQWVSFGQLAPGIVKNITDSGKALSGGFGDFFKKGIKDLFGGATSFSGAVSNMFKGIGTGVFQEIGSMLAGGLSSLIGRGIGLIGKGLGKLFGFGDTEKKKVDAMRQAFIDQIGGWHELNKAAQKTGMTLDKVLNAKKVKDYEKAVGELQRRIELQQTAWGKVQAAIERYGFTIEQLGPALQKQQLTQTALQLYEDFQLLTAAGIDVETVLKQMAAKINAFTQLAVKMGFEVDLSMKPILQKMIEMGLLTDENGVLITDLEESGITFSKSITEAFGEVADAIREMIDLLKLFLGLTEKIPDIGVPGEGGPPPPDTPSPPDIQSLGLLTAGRAATVTLNVYGSVSTERDLVETIRRGLNETSLRRMRAA